MYFSLVIPQDGREREAAQEWNSGGAYREHQWLWRLFPSEPGTPRDFLFRRRDVDELPRYYVVSQRAPVAASSAWRVQTTVYEPALTPGTRLRFDLRANPVVAQRQAEGSSKRHDVVMNEKRRLLKEKGLASWDEWTTPDRPALYAIVAERCTAWLAAKAEHVGFEIDVETLSVDGYQQHGERPRRGAPGADKSESVRFSSVDFSGVLTVTDASAFVATLYRGLGPAKAFGCGLLLVRRAD